MVVDGDMGFLSAISCDVAVDGDVGYLSAISCDDVVDGDMVFLSAVSCDAALCEKVLGGTEIFAAAIMNWLAWTLLYTCN